MAISYYQKVINGKLYPKKARKDPHYCYAHETKREGNKVRSRYLGILYYPRLEAIVVEKRGEVVRELEAREGYLWCNECKRAFTPQTLC